MIIAFCSYFSPPLLEAPAPVRRSLMPPLIAEVESAVICMLLRSDWALPMVKPWSVGCGILRGVSWFAHSFSKIRSKISQLVLDYSILSWTSNCSSLLHSVISHQGFIVVVMILFQKVSQLSWLPTPKISHSFQLTKASSCKSYFAIGECFPFCITFRNFP